MNPLCKVCGDLAAGFHFGVFTCEGCKSFFGRAYNKSQTIPECKKKSKCVINKNTRTTCKACRLTKCIQVGMSKGGSKFGRRSNWFKIKFLLEEQQKDQHSKTYGDSIDALSSATLDSKYPNIGRSAESVMSALQPFDFDKAQDLVKPIYTNAMQYPLHSSFLHKAIEDLSNFYLNQQKLLQQQQQHQQHQQQQQQRQLNHNIPMNVEIDEGDQIREHCTDRNILGSPMSSTASSSASPSSGHNSSTVDNQDYPMDLSLKSRSPVDFSISGLLRINAP